MALQRTRNPRADRLNQGLRALARGRVRVGIPSGSKGDDAEGRPVDYAALGYVFETGDPSTNMPQRPWLVPAVESVRDDINKLLAAGARKLLSGGDPGEYAVTLNKIGLLVQSAAQKRIAQGIAPALAERTVYARLHRRKNRRSPGPMTPLIDTGGFIKAITYSVTV